MRPPQYTARVVSQSPKSPSKGIGCLFLILLMVLLLPGFLQPYAEYMWFKLDVGHPEVFLLQAQTESAIFAIAFLAAFVVYSLNLRFVLSQIPNAVTVPPGWNPGLVQLFDWLRQMGAKATKILAPILALLSASGLAGNWQQLLFGLKGGNFGKVDPLFGLDNGFFIFRLPAYNALVGWVLGLLIFNLFVAGVLYVVFAALSVGQQGPFSSGKAQRHLIILGGFTALFYAAQAWLSRFAYVLEDGFQFTGAGYTSVQRLPLETAYAILLGVVGLLVLVVGIAAPKAGPRVAFIGAGVALLFNILVVNLYPSIFIQKLQVEGDKVNKEAPYAAKAIEATRFGLALDRIQNREFEVKPEPSATELEASKATLDNMRLWDPQVMRLSLDGIQGLRPYYSFDDVDIDRYTLGGKKQMVMLSARNLRLSGLSAQAQTWINTSLQYTHGYGLAMALVDESTSMGQPNPIIGDMPVKSPADIPVKQPQIYFSDSAEALKPALVDTGVEEFDYPTESGGEVHRWKGEHGIPVGSFVNKALMSLVLKDGNLFVSSNIKANTRLLLYRDIRERAAKLYPFFKFDRDPYLVVLDGKLLWLMDAYATSGELPYSQHVEWDGDQINYIRNSVKLTIDAYSGEVNAYVVERDEPIAAMYRRIFPKLFKELSEAPKGLRDHFRYPEDMFVIQTHSLRQYHVSDPKQFLANSDAWEIPVNRGLSGDSSMLDPYYVLMRLPGETKESFVLILPFTPRQKDNMSGWLAAKCDPDEYGKLVLYRFSKGTLVPGPAQMESIFNQDRAIADINRQLSNDQSQIIVGNLLVVPIGSSVMYVEPLFLQSRTPGIQPIPELKKVILALKGKVVVGDSYAEARDKLFGSAPAPTPTTQSVPDVPTKTDSIEQAKARELLSLLNQAEESLKRGDFAKYGELQKQLKAKLQAMVPQSAALPK